MSRDVVAARDRKCSCIHIWQGALCFWKINHALRTMSLKFFSGEGSPWTKNETHARPSLNPCNSVHPISPSAIQVD